MGAVPSVRICAVRSEREGTMEATVKSVARRSVVRSRGATPHCPPSHGVPGRASGSESGFLGVMCLWITSRRRSGRTCGQPRISTASGRCPQVFHRVVHRMADLRAQRRVIHKLLVRRCARRPIPQSEGRRWALGTSYPQAEVIHRHRGMWKSHTPVDNELSTETGRGRGRLVEMSIRPACRRAPGAVAGPVSPARFDPERAWPYLLYAYAVDLPAPVPTRRRGHGPRTLRPRISWGSVVVLILTRPWSQ